MGLLSHLELSLGRCVAASALESMAIAVKCVGRIHEQPSASSASHAHAHAHPPQRSQQHPSSWWMPPSMHAQRDVPRQADGQRLAAGVSDNSPQLPRPSIPATLCCAVPCCVAACRAMGKGSSSAMKAAGLKLAAAVVEGLPQTDRNMGAVQAEAWKLFEKQVKVRGRSQGATATPAHASATATVSGSCRRRSTTRQAAVAGVVHLPS